MTAEQTNEVAPPPHIVWDAVVVHFSEIALKKGNRSRFIKQLRQNVKRVVKPHGAMVERFHDRLLITPHNSVDDILKVVPLVCGVSHVAPIKRLEKDLDVMKQHGVTLYEVCAKGRETFAVRTRRADKRFPYTSGDIDREVGAAIVEATRAPVRLKNPDVLISFRVHEDAVYLEGPRTAGPHGLPVGVTERVLTMFSGGIDSSPAAWLMQCRGSRSDFIHFHVQPDAEQIRETKIPELVSKIGGSQGLHAHLFLIPYHPFEMAMMSAKVPFEYELILFRRFMARVSCAVAELRGYAGIVTGDNLAQVASQTMKNLKAFDDAATTTVFRPLLAFNKPDIITLAKKLDTYDLSIQDYKDCCSLVARHPETQPRLRDIQAIENRLPIAEMTGNALEEMKEWKL